jgi:hypothetical protein
MKYMIDNADILLPNSIEEMEKLIAFLNSPIILFQKKPVLFQTRLIFPTVMNVPGIY